MIAPLLAQALGDEAGRRLAPRGDAGQPDADGRELPPPAGRLRVPGVQVRRPAHRGRVIAEITTFGPSSSRNSACRRRSDVSRRPRAVPLSTRRRAIIVVGPSSRTSMTCASSSRGTSSVVSKATRRRLRPEPAPGPGRPSPRRPRRSDRPRPATARTRPAGARPGETVGHCR